MRVVIQRVSKASVVVDDKLVSSIASGFLLLAGVEDNDTDNDIEWLSNKVINMRIFNDEAGLMNRSLMDIGGEMLVVSQFTLFAATKKGNRPSFIRASKPEFANAMYEKFCSRLSQLLGKEVKRGIFGADMKVSLLNDGPVTIIIDTHNKE